MKKLAFCWPGGVTSYLQQSIFLVSTFHLFPPLVGVEEKSGYSKSFSSSDIPTESQALLCCFGLEKGANPGGFGNLMFSSTEKAIDKYIKKSYQSICYDYL